MPHIDNLETKPTELLILVKVQPEPGVDGTKKPLRRVGEFDEDWVMKQGGEVLRDNLKHKDEEFYLSKLPWPLKTGVEAPSGTTAAAAGASLVGASPAAGGKHLLPSNEDKAKKKLKIEPSLTSGGLAGSSTADHMQY